MIQPFDLRLVEKFIMLWPSWSGWIVATTIEIDCMRNKSEMIGAWTCQNLVFVLMVWKRGEWTMYPWMTEVSPDDQMWLSILFAVPKMWGQDVNSWNRERPDSNGLQANWTWNGRLRDWIVKARCRPWKEYTAQLNCKTCSAIKGNSSLLREREVDGVTWPRSPNLTGMLERWQRPW